MIVWPLVVLSAALLVLPLVLMPRARPDWDFRGFLAFLWYLNAAYCALIHRLRGERAPLPISGPAILISNHTCNIDHCLLQACTGRKLGFMISRKYYDVPAFRPFCDLVDCIPVNGNGQDTAATRAALRALKEGRVLPIFPEGRMVPKSGEEFGEPFAGVAFIATRAKVPVIPAYIRGTPRTNVVWRAFLTPSDSRVVFGEPIDPSVFRIPEGHEAGRAALRDVADRMMGAIKALRDRSLAEDER